MVTLTRLLTAEDLATVPDDGMMHELVEGVLVAMPPPSIWHGRRASRLTSLLTVHVTRHQLGDVVVEAGFVLRRRPDTVRGPDVAFIAAGRFPTDEQHGPPFLEGALDLAVEIVSPGNTKREIAEKVAEYLEAGARLVWVLDAPQRTLTVHRPGQAPQVLSEADTVTGETVVPGFAVAVRDLLD